MKNNFRHRLAIAGIFALFLTYNSPLLSQNLPLKTISGTITDADGALSGVNVLVKNTARGSISDLEGFYEVVVQSSDTLVFRYLGYKTQEVSVGSLSRSSSISGSDIVLNVVMEVDAQALDAVVINAGYYKVSDKEKTGSITRITAKEIENQPVSNPLAALQGRTAGVYISPTTGLAGGSYEVRIRGQNSIAAGNDPLYIIDGVPYDSQTMGFSNVGATIIPGGRISPLSLINTNDIESVEILKDADATAIYGSRGANGVILITTKKGKAGKTQFSVTSYTGTARVVKTLDYMKTEQYLAMRREAFANDGFTEYPADAYDINGTWDQTRYTDWKKELIGGTAYLNDLQASVSGGSNNTTFLMKGGYHKETTVYPKDFKYDKLSVLTKMDHRSIDEKFNLNFSANYAVENNDLPGTDLTQLIRFLPPNAPALYDGSGNLNFENGTFKNPIAELEGKYLTKRNNLIFNTQLSYSPFPDLTFLTNLGYTTVKLEETRTIPNTIYDPALELDSNFSSIYVNSANKESWLIEPQLNYNYQNGASKFEVLVGATFQKQTDDILSQFAKGFASNSLIYNLAAANALFIERDARTEYKYQAFFGRLNYTLQNKYIINLTGRRDGSSRFGYGRRYASFGAVGAAWIFREQVNSENNATAFSFGKFRGSYGVTGNDQIGDYQYLETYSTNGTQYANVSGIEPTRIYNADFGWETNKKFNVGLELGFLNNRINLIGEFYQNRSSNQLVGIPLPGTTGFPSVQANLDAVVENKGFEISLNTINVMSSNFRWTTDFNITIPKNKLVAFPNLEGTTYANQYVIGQPLGIKKLYHVIGVDPETGVYEFEDYNNDGEISAPDDRQYLVDTSPKFYGGLNNSFSFKNWELNILFQFSKRKGLNYVLGSAPPGQMAGQPEFIEGQWQNTGDEADIQLFTAGYNTTALLAYYKYIFSDASYTDASFIRLRNASINYTLPESGIENLKCKIFLQGDNLLLFSNFKSGDPEQITGFLPPLRKITLGVQISI